MCTMDRQYIYNKIDLIEAKTKTMIQDIPVLERAMREWQDYKLNNSYFNEALNKYLDKLNKE